jgi:hypothetical protein
LNIETEDVMNTTTLDTHATEAQATRSISRHLSTGGRVLLGLTFFVFGLNGFLNFLPQPAGMPEGALSFAGALAKTSYMFPLIKGTEVVVGALLLSNRFVPLALAIIAPIVINIFAFHLFLAPGGIGLAAVILALEVYLAWAYREVYRPMLAARVVPSRIERSS